MFRHHERHQADRTTVRRLLQDPAVHGAAREPSQASPPTAAGSQTLQYSSPPFTLTADHFNPSIVTVMVILLIAFFFMGFLSLYVVRFRRRSTALASLRNAVEAFAADGSSQGLDPGILRGLPVIAYSSAKKKGNNVECVVCLVDFEEQEPLRQLPGCKHVFHQDCIDMWLYSHSTCPLCRRKIGVASSGAFSSRWGSGSFRNLPFLSRGGSGVPHNEPPAAIEEAGGMPLIESGTRLHIQTGRSAGMEICRSASAEMSNATASAPARREWDNSRNAANEPIVRNDGENRGQGAAGINEQVVHLARANSTGHSLTKLGSS